MEEARGTAYGVWYKPATTKVYAIDPDDPEASMQVLKPVAMQSVVSVGKVMYPANRWRDNNDYFTMTVKRPEEANVAPDGVTLIPRVYDLIRSNALLAAYPGRPFYAVDEYNKRTVRYEVSPQGYLSDPAIFVEKGEYKVAVDPKGNVYIPNGQIYVYDEDGELIDEIEVPERPATIAFDREGDTLYITARTSLYRVEIE